MPRSLTENLLLEALDRGKELKKTAFPFGLGRERNGSLAHCVYLPAKPHCRGFGGAVEHVGGFLARHRVRLSLVFFSLLLFDDVLEGVIPAHTNLTADRWAQVGLVLVGLGIALRSWAAGVLSKKSALACTGPYSLARHPLYVGSFLMTLGFCTLIGDRRSVWLALAVMVVLYRVRIRREEQTLHATFGWAWRRYVARTGLFLPRRFPIALGCRWSFSQWRRNREYRTLLATLAGLVALTIWHWVAWSSAVAGHLK